jgi:hypothetical protein
MKYDDASWHYGGDFPKDQPEKNGGTHIALFIRWCFTKGWAGSLHLKEEPVEVEKVVNGTLSATEFLFKYSDGKFTDEDLNEAGNAFAAKYYGDNGLFLDDYATAFEDQMYTASEAEHEFKKFSSILETRLGSGIFTKSSCSLQSGTSG